MANVENIPRSRGVPKNDEERESLGRLCRFVEVASATKARIIPNPCERLLVALIFSPQARSMDIRAEDLRFLWCQMDFPEKKSCLMLPLVWLPETCSLLLAPRRDRLDLALYAKLAEERPRRPDMVKMMPLHQAGIARKFFFTLSD